MLKLWLRHTIFHKIEGKQTNEFNISRIKSFPLYSSMKKKTHSCHFLAVWCFCKLGFIEKKTIYNHTNEPELFLPENEQIYFSDSFFFLLGLKCFTD